VQSRATQSLFIFENLSERNSYMLPMNEFEKSAASRHIFGAEIVGRQIELSLDLVDGIRSNEREQPTGGSSVCITFSHHAEQHILTTNITRDCKLPRIGLPRIPATRDSSSRRAGNVCLFNFLPFIRCPVFAVS